MAKFSELTKFEILSNVRLIDKAHCNILNNTMDEKKMQSLIKIMS